MIRGVKVFIYAVLAVIIFFIIIYNIWAGYSGFSTEDWPSYGKVIDIEYRKAGRISGGYTKRMVVVSIKENNLAIIDEKELNVGDYIDGLYLTSLGIPTEKGEAQLATKRKPNPWFHIIILPFAIFFFFLCLTRAVWWNRKSKVDTRAP